MSIEKVYMYKDVEYKSAFAVKVAILGIENKAIPKEPEEGKEEFWAQYGVTYTEVEVPDPVEPELEPETPEEAVTRLTRELQKYLDSTAAGYGYDSILSACSYIDTDVEKYDIEGAAFKAWRSAVWKKFYEITDAYLESDGDAPTLDSIKEQLPELKIEYLEAE